MNKSPIAGQIPEIQEKPNHSCGQERPEKNTGDSVFGSTNSFF